MKEVLVEFEEMKTMMSQYYLCIGGLKSHVERLGQKEGPLAAIDEIEQAIYREEMD